MKTLREYLERNNYSIVQALKEMLSIDDDAAKAFYSALSLSDESKVIDALKEPETEEKKAFVHDLYGEYTESMVQENNQFDYDYVDGKYNIINNETKEVVDTAHSGHEAQNLVYSYNQEAKKNSTSVEEADDLSQLAGKAAVGGYNPARELSKGQYQPKIVQNKKFKTNRQGDKSNLKRGMYENAITPVIINENNQYKFKLLDSEQVSSTSNITAIFESSTVISPMGGISSIPGVGMSGLRKLAGLADMELEMPKYDQIGEIESVDVNDVLALISQMDDETKEIVLNAITQDTSSQQSIVDVEQLEIVKTAICDFGAALQAWIEQSNGYLDFLCPLVDALWVKYNEFEI